MLPATGIRVGGKPYTVAAVIQYKGRDAQRWTEYELVSAAGEWISLEHSSDEEWSLSRHLSHGTKRVHATAKEAELFGTVFPHYDNYAVSVDAILGEFEKLPNIGDRLRFACYEGEDYDLMAELGPDGKPCDWYLSYECDEPDMAGAALSEGASFQARHSSSLASSPKMEVAKWSAIFATLAVAIHLLFAQAGQNQLVYTSETRTVGDGVQWVSEPFRLTGRTSNVVARVDTDLNNQWLGLELTLVNTANSQWYRRYEEISLFQGYEGGESWREGDPDPDIYFSSIPAGEYVLQVEATADYPGLAYQFTLHRDVANSNYLLYVLAIFGVLPAVFALQAMES